MCIFYGTYCTLCVMTWKLCSSRVWSWRRNPWGPYPHDDVIKWKYFPRCWPFLRGIHRSLVNSPHKGQWRGALMICARINGWVDNGDAGDLWRHRAHYDVIVMSYTSITFHTSPAFASYGYDFAVAQCLKHFGIVVLFYWLWSAAEESIFIFRVVYCDRFSDMLSTGFPCVCWRYNTVTMVSQTFPILPQQHHT